jgi:hypothetical protein
LEVGLAGVLLTWLEMANPVGSVPACADLLQLLAGATKIWRSCSSASVRSHWHMCGRQGGAMHCWCREGKDTRDREELGEFAAAGAWWKQRWRWCYVGLKPM